jgi:chromosome segregation ATPase
VKPEEIIRRLQRKTQARVDQLKIDFALEKGTIQKKHKQQMTNLRIEHENEVKKIKSDIENLTSLHQKNLDAINSSLDAVKAEKTVICSYITNLKMEMNKLQEKYDIECYRNAKGTEKGFVKELTQKNQKEVTEIDKTEAIKMQEEIGQLNKSLAVERTKTLADELLIARLKEDFDELKSDSNSQNLKHEKMISELKGFNQELVGQVKNLKKQLEQKKSSQVCASSVKDKENLGMKSFNSDVHTKLKEMQEENFALKRQISSLNNEINAVGALNTKIMSLEAKLNENKHFYTDLNFRFIEEVKQLNEKRNDHYNSIREKIVKDQVSSNKRKLNEISSNSNATTNNVPAKKSLTVKSSN